MTKRKIIMVEKHTAPPAVILMHTSEMIYKTEIIPKSTTNSKTHGRGCLQCSMSIHEDLKHLFLGCVGWSFSNEKMRKDIKTTQSFEKQCHE